MERLLETKEQTIEDLMDRIANQDEYIRQLNDDYKDLIEKYYCLKEGRPYISAEQIITRGEE